MKEPLIILPAYNVEKEIDDLLDRMVESETGKRNPKRGKSLINLRKGNLGRVITTKKILVLCITGIVLVILAVVMLLNVPGYQDEQVKDNEDITEVAQEIKDGEGLILQPSIKRKQSRKQVKNRQPVIRIVSYNQVQQSAHDINPEVYEWACANEHFDGREEPRQVTEFAKYKEYYEEIDTNVTDREKIMYFYDETLTNDDPLPSEKDDLMSHYSMVNIAPHWWWEELGDGK